MNAVFFRFFVLVVAGWIRRGQQDVIEYLVAENRVLREQLGERRPRLTDGQRRRLAVPAKVLGRSGLQGIAGIATPEDACLGCRIPVEALDRAVLNCVGEQVFTDDRSKETLREFVEEQGSLRKQSEERRRRLLVREHDDVERRLARWYERIESDDALPGRGGGPDPRPEARRLSLVVTAPTCAT